MISAGLVLAKIVGTFPGATCLAGTALRTSAKLASDGNLLNAGGNFAIALYGPVAAGADSQTPLFRRYQVPSASWNTSQLVLTANFSPLLPAGAMTGSPSNTTRLAGRSA